MKETETQAVICDYIALRKHFFWRQNTQPSTYFDKSGARQFRAMPKHAMRGIPDIIFIKDGRFVGLEVKAGTQQLEGQIEFERGCKQAGGEYHVVRSIEDVQRVGL